jgi:hypothetical protein
VDAGCSLGIQRVANTAGTSAITGKDHFKYRKS